MPKSRYTLAIEGLSGATRSKDIQYEMERYGKVEEVERDVKDRLALVRFKRSDDAAYAYRKAEGTKMDGRTWRVDWARRGDFDFFGWPWKEEGGEGGRSPSRSPSQGARMDA